MISSRSTAGRSLACVISFLACTLFIAGCSLPWQRGQNTVTLGAKPTAQQLLTALQKNFRNVNSFHVVMNVQNPGPVRQGQVQIRTANGDIVMPDKVKAQATIILSGQAVTVNLISIGSNQFITDPITGQWRVIKGVLDPRTLTNPDTGILSLINKVQNVSDPVSDTVNGVPCWRVKGQLNAKYLAFLPGAACRPARCYRPTPALASPMRCSIN